MIVCKFEEVDYLISEVNEALVSTINSNIVNASVFTALRDGIQVS